MVKFRLAGLLAIAAIPVQAQPPVPAAQQAAPPVPAQPSALATPAPINPSTDTARERQRLREFSACIAHYRPLWVRQLLAKPYLSNDQARLASYVLSGRDSCVQGHDVEVTFRTSSLVSSLAEQIIRDEMPRIDFAALRRALTTIEGLNVSEEFALCVAARNPAAARDLAMSDYGSAAETAAAHALAEPVAFCTLPNEHLTYDLQSLRALTATALYRGVTTMTASRN